MNKDNILINLLRLDILIQIALPAGAFWYFGYTDLEWAHRLISGPKLGTISIITTLVGLFFYYPAIIKTTREKFPKTMGKALNRVFSPLLVLGLIYLFSRTEATDWIMIAGTHFYSGIMFAAVIQTGKNLELRPKFLASWAIFILVVGCGLFSVLLFQLAALPVYLYNIDGMWLIILAMIVWFGGITQNIYFRLKN